MTSYLIYRDLSWMVIFLITFATSLATKSKQRIYINKINISSIVYYEKEPANVPIEKIKKELDELSEIERNIHYVRTSKLSGGPNKLIRYFYIDVVAIADYSVVMEYEAVTYLFGLNKSMVKPSIRRDIAHLFSGAKRVYLQNQFSIPGMFDFKIVLNLVDIIIFEREEESFLTGIKEGILSNEVDAQKAIESFVKFANKAGEKRDFDHMTLFTSYDLVSTRSGKLNRRRVGVAAPSRMCVGESSVSIIEGLMDGSVMFNLVHQIGSALGANQDGKPNNNCRTEDHYVMSAVIGASAKTLNRWKFSECSRKDIALNILRLYNGGTKDFLDKEKAKDADFEILQKYMCDCYTKKMPIQKLVPDVSKIFRGSEIISAHQCLFNGYVDDKGQCDRYLPSLKSCLIRYCLKKQIFGEDQCAPILPYRGTSCGAGKVCENGYCRSIWELRKEKMDFSPDLTAPACDLEAQTSPSDLEPQTPPSNLEAETPSNIEPQKSSYCSHNYGLTLVIVTLLACGTLTE